MIEQFWTGIAPWPWNGILWFLSIFAICMASTWVQRTFGWVVWGAVMFAVVWVYIFWKVFPL